MERIKRLSRFLEIVFKVLLVLYPLMEIITWLAFDVPLFKKLAADGVIRCNVKLPQGETNLFLLDLNTNAKLVALAASIVGSCPLFTGLWWLGKIFRNYAQGFIFHLENAIQYRKLGWLFILDAVIAKPLGDMLMVFAATLNNPPGQRLLSIGFGNPNMENILTGSIVILISWIMAEAHRLEKEQELTV